MTQLPLLLADRTPLVPDRAQRRTTRFTICIRCGVEVVLNYDGAPEDDIRIARAHRCTRIWKLHEVK